MPIVFCGSSFGPSLSTRVRVRESLLNISFFLLLKKALSKETKRIPLKIESRTVVSTFARRLLVVSSRRRFVHFPFLCQLEHFRQHGDLVVGVSSRSGGDDGDIDPRAHSLSMGIRCADFERTTLRGDARSAPGEATGGGQIDARTRRGGRRRRGTRRGGEDHGDQY